MRSWRLGEDPVWGLVYFGKMSYMSYSGKYGASPRDIVFRQRNSGCEHFNFNTGGFGRKRIFASVDDLEAAFVRLGLLEDSQ